MVSNFIFDSATFVSNKFFELDIETYEKLKNLGEATIKVELTDLSMHFFLHISEEKLALLADYKEPVDAVIRGSAFAFIKMTHAMQSGSASIPKDLQISGNIELVENLNALLKQLDIDWEEQIAKLCGDTIAHTVGNAVRGILAWGEKTNATMQANVTEYLQEETKSLPTRLEIEDFFEDVTSIRNDVDRIEAKVNRL